jgi:hypothetical protein
MRERTAAGLAVVGLLIIGHAIVTRTVTSLPTAAAEFGIGTLFIIVSLLLHWRVWE